MEKITTWGDIKMEDVCCIESYCKNCDHVNLKYNTDNMLCEECGKDIFAVSELDE